MTYIRWGCTSQIPYVTSEDKIINTASAIHTVNDKAQFAKKISNCFYHISFPTVTSLNEAEEEDPGFLFPAVVRPSRHSRGKNLWVVDDVILLKECLEENNLHNGWYARPFINKVEEYRVFVMCGRVVSVCRKIPDDCGAIAWNVAQGGYFENVRWNDWDFDACDIAIGAIELSKLHFGGVDIMVDDSGQCYVIEVNSAPSLPMKSDGTPTYRQTCMAKCFFWHLERNDWDWIEVFGDENWRDHIHPGCCYDTPNH